MKNLGTPTPLLSLSYIGSFLLLAQDARVSDVEIGFVAGPNLWLVRGCLWKFAANLEV